jgi:hypothetical protein
VFFEKNYRLQDIQLSKSPPSLPAAASARQAAFATRQSLAFGHKTLPRLFGPRNTVKALR